MCPITDDHASDPCRGPLCAHFRAFSRSAYVEKVTEGLRDCKAKTNGLLACLSDILFDEEDEELKPEVRFEFIDKAGMHEVSNLFENSRGELALAFQRCAKLEHEVCLVCETLAPVVEE